MYALEQVAIGSAVVAAESQRTSEPSNCSDVVAIVSAIVAVLSLLVGAGALVYARRSDRRAREGRPSAGYLGCSLDGQPGQADELASFNVRVTNVGAAGARHVMVDLIDASGYRVGRSSGTSLAPNASEDVVVRVPQPRRYEYPLTIRLGWWLVSDPNSLEPPHEHISHQKIEDPFGS